MHFHHSQHLRYRPEIDGLRAIAVLSVILFHADIPYLSGGFTGVDIFYVISGYLITKILISNLLAERFSFVEFYSRRIKRLLPAAFLTLLLTVFFGLVILPPDKYVELAKSSLYATFFLANLWFMNNSGYFDQSTETTPLVHLWSLAVEEQFYLLFPALLFIAFLAKRLTGVKILVVVIFLVSLVASISLSARFPNFSFYMLPTRAWELSIGSLLVLYPFLHPHKQLHCYIVSVNFWC